MAYAPGEREKLIPGQMTEGEQLLAMSEQQVRAIGADKAPYKPQYGAQGAISQTPASQMAQADVRQQAITGAFKPDQQISANVTKQYGPQGELLGYAGRGTGRPSLDQQERDKEMSSRGMVRDAYGNWMPPGGWGVGEQSSQADNKTGYFDNPAMNEKASPQINYDGDWNDYFKSIAPATAASKSRRIAQEQAGAERLGEKSALLRNQGALGLVDREGALRRQAAGEERAFKQPEQEAQIAAHNAQSRLYGSQADVTGYSAESAKQMAIADSILRSPTTHTAQQVDDARALIKRKNQDAIDLAVAKAQATNQTGPYAEDVVHKADGGLIEGYADGGAIGRAQTQQLNPLVSQYGQYLQAAAQTGVSPVPFAQYINLLGSTRGAMQQTPSQFADGGDVSALKRPLEGPGTGRSDSIPALIDGIKPAALSRGEFVLDEETTKYYGTKFLKELQRKAKEALTGGDEGAPANG